MDEMQEAQRLQDSRRLTDCLRFEEPEALAARLAEYSAEEWQSVLRQGRKHGLLPLVYKRLGRLAKLPESLSDESREELKRQYLSCVGRNLMVYRNLETIVQALGAAGIEVILLKGAHLAKWVYGDIGVRPMGDVDLLIRREQLARAAEVMVEIGYQAERPYNLKKELGHHHHLPPYYGHGTMVELHATIASPLDPLRVDVDGLWERSVPLPLALQANPARDGTTARGLCPEDLLLHLALHLLKDEFRAGLRIVCDMATSVERSAGGLDIEKLTERAQAWGMQRGLFLTVYLAEALLGAPVRPKLMEGLRPVDFSTDIARMAEERVRTIREREVEVHPNVAHLLRKQPLAERWRRLWLSLWPYPEYVAMKYNLPEGSAMVYSYYLIRWIDMVRKFGGQLWRLGHGEGAALEEARRQNLVNDWCRESH